MANYSIASSYQLSYRISSKLPTKFASLQPCGIEYLLLLGLLVLARSSLLSVFPQVELADGLYSSLAFPPMVLVVSSSYSGVLQDTGLTDMDCLTGTFPKSLDMSPRLYLDTKSLFADTKSVSVDMKSLSADKKSLSADTKSLSADTKSLSVDTKSFVADNIADY